MALIKQSLCILLQLHSLIIECNALLTGVEEVGVEDNVVLQWHLLSVGQPRRRRLLPYGNIVKCLSVAKVRPSFEVKLNGLIPVGTDETAIRQITVLQVVEDLREAVDVQTLDALHGAVPIAEE